MAECRILLPFCLLLAALVAGCGKKPLRAAGSGSRDTARKYYEALVHRDWPAAYALLHPDSRARVSTEQFDRLAQTYRDSLGFEPEAVYIRAWDERDSEATVHVILIGQANEKTRRYKDGIKLLWDDEAWRIELPQHFGQSKTR